MFRSSAVAALLFLAACTGSSRDTGSVVVARIDAEAVQAGEVAAALASDDLVDRNPVVYRRTLESLIDRKLLLRAARERGVQVADGEVERAWKRMQADYPGDAFADQLAAQRLDGNVLRARLRESLLVERLFVDEVVARVAVTDDEIETWLAAHGVPEGEPERVRAAQIVVRTETEAVALRHELQQGASFEELAHAHSLSPDGKRGGDLGFFARGEMPPPFDEVCFALAPGKISEVVSSSYGFHVFKVLERREARAPDLTARRAEAERRLRRQKEAAAQRAFVARLREAAKIEVDEAALERLVGSP